MELINSLSFTFIQLADAFVQSDLQMRTIEAIKSTRGRQVTFIYAALFTIQIVSKHIIQCK